MTKTYHIRTAAMLARRAARMAKHAWDHDNVERHDKYEHLAFLLGNGIKSGDFITVYASEDELREIRALDKGSYSS